MAATLPSASSRTRSPTAAASSTPGATCWRLGTIPTASTCFARATVRCTARLILVVDHFVPEPDRDAGSRTMMGFLRVLTDAGLLVKFWPHNGSYSAGYTEALQQMGIEVAVRPAAEAVRGVDAGQRRRIRLSSCSAVRRSPRMCCPSCAGYCQGPVIYYGHDLHFSRMKRQAEMTGDDRIARAASRMEDRERRLWREADLSLYPSGEEADIARALQPDCAVPSGGAVWVRDLPAPA